MEAQHRNPEAIFDVGIDLTATIRIGNHAAYGEQRELGAKFLVQAAAKILSVKRLARLVRQTREMPRHRHGPSADQLNVILGGEFQSAGSLLAVSPPRHIS